jgi:phospholipid/cholesterol/gamma-HCH transport system substrate-binding protein
VSSVPNTVANSVASQHKRPLIGLVYLVVIAALIATSIQAYRKALPWQDSVDVTLTTTNPGLELNPLSDVKLQGVRVGEVRRITSDGTSATVELRLDPDLVDLIPANVDAAIIPKTLFGEKYVDLRVPDAPSSDRIAEGAVIRQSTTSVEIGRLFSRLVPVLRVLKPEELSTLLGSLAEALDGRGVEVAQTLNQLQGLSQALDPHLAALSHDLTQFSRTADLYADSAPELIRVLANASGISTDLLVPQEQRLATFLDNVISTAGLTQDVLAENSQHLIDISGRVRPVLAVLDEYSAGLPCLLKGLHTGDILLNQTASRGPFVNLTVDVIAQQEPYRYPEDLPSNPDSDANNANLPLYVPRWGPHCPEFSAEVRRLKDVAPNSQPLPGAPIPTTSQDRTALDGAVIEASMAMARALAAQQLDVSQEDVPAYAELLLGPMLSDGEVRVP